MWFILWVCTTVLKIRTICHARDLWRLARSCKHLHLLCLADTCKQNGHHFPDDIFKCIILNENIWISIKIALKFVCKGPINSIPVLVQIMAWYWPGQVLTSHYLNQWWLVNSLRPSDAIWRHRSGSTLAQVMAWCLTAPSHYLNQCWLIISKV